METHLAASAGTWDSEQGAFISESHRHLAQVLKDYNPYFSLVWVPPKDRAATDERPFAILDSGPHHAPYIIRYLSEEDMKDAPSILGWVFEGDLTKHRPVDVLARIELREKARELLKLKKREDELAEQQDKLEFIGRTKLNRYKIGKTVHSNY